MTSLRTLLSATLAGLVLCLLAVKTTAVESGVPQETPVPIAKAEWITAEIPGTAVGQAQQKRSPGVHVTGADRSPDAQTVPLPIFRKSFIVKDASISKAQLVICGLGHFELSINGTKVGDHFLDPPWSDYADTCYTVRFDVAELLTPGENVLGVMLGNGMYNVTGGRYAKFTGSFGPPKLTLCLAISQGNHQQIINSDVSWKTDAGPITFSCIYGGEDYDARREQPGWDSPGFDDSLWKPVTVVDGPGGTLRPATSPPVKVIRHLEPVSVTKLEDGRYEVDLGENLSAYPVVKVKGKAGSRVTIETAEQKGKPWQGHSYTFTLKGDAQSEVFAPRFTYFGFQYLYVSGVAWGDDINSTHGVPALIEIGADFVSSCGPRIGTFACSNPLFNEIDDMIDRSVTSNLQHVLTDCPHREKLGWLEVAHLMGPSILSNYDMGELFRKICRDTTDSQLENGLIPDIAPEYVRFNGGFFESPEWGSAAVQLPWLHYRWYGDESILREQYSTMARYTDYLASTRNAVGLVKGGLGDWYDWTPEKGHVGSSQLTPNELPATAMFYDNARILWQTATLQGKVADAGKWKALMQAVRRDFLAAYYDEPSKTVATGSQCALALGLYFRLVPDQDRDAVVANLVQTLEESQYRQSTGEVSFRYLVMALAEAGRSDVVYRMINRTDAPGYGCMLKQGLKTLSERWDRPGSSLNHCMFGHIQEWFQTYVLGIRQAPGSIGYEKVLIDPFMPDDLDWAAGSFDSPNGRIEVAWARKGTTVEVTIETEKAEVMLPPGRKDVQWKVKTRSVTREVFTLEDRPAFLLLPEKTESDDSMPWVWYAPTLEGLPGNAETWMFDRFLAHGIAIAGVDVGESYGSPGGRALYSVFYKTLVEEHGLAKQACLLARSRGGLMLYNWAAENPESVACIAGIYPVCNLSSYPGLDRAAGAYNMTQEQLAAELIEHNPVDRLATLAKAKVPIFHIHGDSDEVVPLDKNSGELKKRYDKLAGKMTLEIVKGQGHNMWPGWFQSQDLVDFVITHAREDKPNVTVRIFSGMEKKKIDMKKGDEALLGASTGLARKDALSKRPNVILIMTDDQGYGDLACHGNPIIKTPNLDTLHAQSVRFTNFHVNAFCAPTRAALLTGRMSDRTHVRTTIYSRNHLNRDETTMAEFFKATGYRTGHFGKWHLGRNYPYRPMDRGFDQWVGHGDGGTGTSSDYWGNDKMNDTYWRNGKWERFSGFCTDIYFDEAMKFIEGSKDKPFFVYLATNVPHGPWHVPKAWRRPYEVNGTLDSRTVDFYATISRFDHNLGRLRTFLAEKKLDNNTLIVYLTDNGTSGGDKVFNDGMRGKKGSVYEGGHRVPCFMHWPAGGLKQAVDIDRFTNHFDLLPTLTELCRLETPTGGHLEFDGTSLVPLLKDAKANWPDRAVFMHVQNVREEPVKWMNSVVLTEQWRLINGKELYDIKIDPGQTQDIARSHPDVVADMRQRYERHWDELDMAGAPYARPIVGSMHEAETWLNPDAWIIQDEKGPHTWDQSHVRSGANNSGFWPVELATDGTYQFDVRRWPKELDHPITASLPAAHTGDIDSLGLTVQPGMGKAIPAERVELVVGTTTVQTTIGEFDTGARFDVTLPAGDTNVRAWLIDANGNKRGAYYIYVKKISREHRAVYPLP